MSVRRLAEPAVQPAAFAFSNDNAAWVEATINKYPPGRQQSAVIPLLMRAQEQEGWVTKAAIEHVAERLSMPYIRALEVATFYTQFQLKPVGTRAHVQVCGTTPCMLRGSEALMDVCRSKIHHEQFHANAEGTLSWEEVECLGACVNAPMVMIFKDTYEDLTPERLAEIIDAFDAGKGNTIVPGPQNGRVYSAPISGLTSLSDEAAVLKSTRDREASAAASQQAPAAPADVSPSNAAKPKTHAAETDPSVKSPSPVKASQAAESAASVVAPKHSANEANKASPAVEAVAKPRSASKGKAASAPSEEQQPTKPADFSVAPAKPSLYDKDRPAAIEKPEQPDDLRLISGVGPKIEGILHSLGVYTFAQIASWKKGEREWVDSYLNFRGRIDRDEWVKQAETLARGGVAEYVRVFGKEPR
jgi:NADH-quinone oxidoreductase subunit E